MKHIVCYSGGHSSALVAIEVARRYGKQNVVLVNHDINPKSEDADIKRFKNEVAYYLDIEIHFENMPGWEDMDQFDVALQEKAFTINNYASCTKKLKTEPFYKYIEREWSHRKDQCIIYYGFDANEQYRIDRKIDIMAEDGYKTEYPLADWERTIKSTIEIGIEPPLSYSNFKHANCKGCFKGGAQHWYVVYCLHPEIFEKAKQTEGALGYSIIKGKYLNDVECDFFRMKHLGIEPTEHKPSGQFWKEAKDKLRQPSLFNYEKFEKTCECGI
jgi:hypothetical protein